MVTGLSVAYELMMRQDMGEAHGGAKRSHFIMNRREGENVLHEHAPSGLLLPTGPHVRHIVSHVLV
jgi:hypothetical protein